MNIKRTAIILFASVGIFLCSSVNVTFGETIDELKAQQEAAATRKTELEGNISREEAQRVNTLRLAEEELKAGNRETADSLIEAARNIQSRIDTMKSETTQIAQEQETIQQRIDNPTYNTLFEQREADESALSDAQKAVSDAQAALEAANKSGDATKIEEAQKALTDARTVENARIQTLSESENKIQQTTEFKIKEISDKYTTLIAGTVQKGSDIGAKISNCGNCGEKSILERQLEANEEYIHYLERRQFLELCQVNPDCSSNEEEIKKLQDAVNEQAQIMRDILKVLTEEEMKRNVEKTFNVSGVFSLEGQNTTKRSIQEVVDTIANWLVTLVSSLAVTALIIGGFMMIISGGDENRLETGKTIFIYSLIGLTVTLLSFGIITFIQSLFY